MEDEIVRNNRSLQGFGVEEKQVNSKNVRNPFVAGKLRVFFSFKKLILPCIYIIQDLWLNRCALFTFNFKKLYAKIRKFVFVYTQAYVYQFYYRDDEYLLICVMNDVIRSALNGIIIQNIKIKTGFELFCCVGNFTSTLALDFARIHHTTVSIKSYLFNIGGDFLISIFVGTDRFHLATNDTHYCDFYFRAPVQRVTILQVSYDLPSND